MVVGDCSIGMEKRIPSFHFFLLAPLWQELMVSEQLTCESGPLFATGQSFQQAVNKKHSCFHSPGRMELGQPCQRCPVATGEPKARPYRCILTQMGKTCQSPLQQLNLDSQYICMWISSRQREVIGSVAFVSLAQLNRGCLAQDLQQERQWTVNSYPSPPWHSQLSKSLLYPLQGYLFEV